MTNVERYQYRKQNNLCAYCGYPNDSLKAVCSKCSQKRKEKYQKRKESGICVYCGEPVSNRERISCSKCIEKKRDLRRWEKEHGICTNCGSNPASPGKTLCAECCLKMSITRQKRKSEETEEQNKEYREKKLSQYRRRKNRRIENGLCITCGRKVVDVKNYCLDCLLKQKKQNKQYRQEHNLIKDHKFFGECKWCTNKPLPNNSFCEEYYKVVCQNLEKARNSPKAIAARKKFKKEKIDVFWSEMKYYGKQKSN